MEAFIFYSLAFVAVMSALHTIFVQNPLYSILSLVVTFFSIAGIYIFLNAQFLGIVQVIVYAGAIMVLFLYVLMMLNLNTNDEAKKGNKMKVIGVISSGILLIGILGVYRGVSEHPLEFENRLGLTKNLGKLLFNKYVLPFELASILILASIVGVVLIGKKES